MSQESPDPPEQRLARSFGFREVDPAQKAGLVRGVFDSVAGRYDLMNDLMSLGVHRLWKEAMIDWLAPRPGMRILDVAGGTGDIGFRILDRTREQAGIVSLDANASMLAVGRDRAFDANRFANVTWVASDAESLPFGPAAFDAYTIAFGIRNVTRIDRALAEARRVLRPGGRFLCIEFGAVGLAWLDRLYELYSFNVVPALGAAVAGDAESYRYLVESIRRFPDQAAFTGLVQEAGLERARYRNLSGGIAVIYSAWRL